MRNCGFDTDFGKVTFRLIAQLSVSVVPELPAVATTVGRYVVFVAEEKEKLSCRHASVS